MMTAGEHLRAFRETCVRIAGSGFLRTAWTALEAELRRTAPTVSFTEKVEATIALMEMRIADNVTEVAYPQLKELATASDVSEIHGSLRLHLEEVTFRVCLEGYHLVEAGESLNRVRAFASVDPRVESMTSELGVAQFLHAGILDMSEGPHSAYECGARAELRAMRGELEEALTELAARADEFGNAGSPKEAAWLREKRAELLWADCRFEEAWNAFGVIHQNESSLSIIERATYARNRAFVGVSLGKNNSHQEYYAAADQTREVDRQFRDLISAEDASRKRNHFDSLPPLWRELLRAYYAGDWSRRGRAHDRLALETLAAGWIREAVHHTILGDNETAAKQLVDTLIAWRASDAIDAAISYVLDRQSNPPHQISREDYRDDGRYCPREQNTRRSQMA